MFNKIRYKKDLENLNIGFTKSEIHSLRKQLNFELPELYLNFLLNAGKKSNVLEHDFKNIDDLIELQNEFKSKINNSDLENFNFSNWCFSYNGDDYFYFEPNNKNPTVSIYSNKVYPVDNGWNNKLGFISGKSEFAEFINSRTNQKYNYSLLENIKRFTILIIFSPILFLIFLFLEVGKRIK